MPPPDKLENFVKELEYRFSSTQKPTLDELKPLFKQPGLWYLKNLWNRTPLLKRILALDASPEIIVYILIRCTKSEYPIRELSEGHEALLTNYFIAQQRIDLCFKFYSAIWGKLYESVYFFEPLVSALLTGQLKEDALQYYLDDVLNGQRYSSYAETQPAVYRTIMRNELFAQKLFAILKDKETSLEIWLALCSHKSLRWLDVKPEFQTIYNFACSYHDVYEHLQDPNFTQQLRAGTTTLEAIKAVLRVKPQLMYLDSDKFCYRGGDVFYSCNDDLLALFSAKHQEIMTILFAQGKPHLREKLEKLPLSNGQKIIVFLATTLSIITLGLFNTLVWLIGCLLYSKEKRISWNPSDYFNRIIPVIEFDFKHRLIEFGREEKCKFSEETSIDLLANIFVIAKQKNIRLIGWNLLISGLAECLIINDGYNELSNNLYYTISSNSKFILTVRRFEEACLYIEKMGQLPSNFDKIVRSVKKLPYISYSLEQREKNTRVTSTSLSWVDFVKEYNPTIDIKYIGYSCRWLHHLQLTHPQLATPLKQAQEILLSRASLNSDSDFQRRFGPSSYRWIDYLSNSSLSIWAPPVNKKVDNISRYELSLELMKKMKNRSAKSVELFFVAGLAEEAYEEYAPESEDQKKDFQALQTETIVNGANAILAKNLPRKSL